MTDRHKREVPIMALFKELGFSAKEKINTSMALEKLTDDELKGLEGFKAYCEVNGQSNSYIASNIGHDIHGIVEFRNRPDDGFCPRTESYAKYAKEAISA